MDKASTVSQDFSGVPIIFIHSSLDDCGVSVSAFRVYGHIARRANRQREAFPGIDSMATICRMNRKTVIAAIRELESRRMMLVERAPGKTTHYLLTDHKEWIGVQNEERSEGSPIEVTLPVQNEERTRPKEGTKGNPSKDIQSKGVQPCADLPGQTFLFGEEPAIIEKSKKADVDLTFAIFYKAYPRKVGRQAALSAFKRKQCAPKIELILRALETQKASEQWQKDGGQFIPHPATWLNQGRWEDEIPLPNLKKTQITTGVAALKARK